MEKPLKVYTHINPAPVNKRGVLEVVVMAELSWAFGWHEVIFCQHANLEKTLDGMYRRLRADIFASGREMNIVTRYNGKKI